jgi:D-glycero-D-manno-heptose 1,7-bisphosphate phosphatase
MKRPAIFFDRDNTLIVSDGYLGDPEKVVLMEGSADAVARARSLGFATIVFSNQSGVARGMFSEADVELVNRRIDEMLLAANRSAVIDRHEFCPYHPEGTVEPYNQESERRKPKPGMILEAARKLAIDLERSWVIGDAPRDIDAGKSAGCRAILLRPENIAESPAAQQQIVKLPDYVATSLKQAIDVVESHMDAPPAAEDVVPPARPPQQTAAISSTPPPTNLARIEQLAEQILTELRKANEHRDYSDFSVSRLLAGISQVIALAVLFVSYLNRQETSFLPLMLLAIFLQALTISLLIMGRQR